jgi:hypothetical protein
MAKERPSLDQMTLRQLRKVASDYNVFRYSRMRKAQLLATVQKIEQNKQQKTESSRTDLQEEQQVEAAKFEIGQDDQIGGLLASVDEDLGELPGGYGKSRIVLLPRDPQWAYTYWDISNKQKEELRRQGGQQLTLRIYDVTEFDFTTRSPHTVQEYLSDELAREWYLPIPVSNRDYVTEIGYRCWDGRWLMLARSAPVHIPPVYPSDWVEDVFVTVDWEQDLAGQAIDELAQVHLHQKGVKPEENDLYQRVFELAKAAEFRRVDGSIFGSMHHIPIPVNHEQVISSHIFPSGIGREFAVNVSGLNMSGIGMNMSGVGFGASLPPEKPRKFWLIADAELIIHGATEPDANLTIAGRPVKLQPDGTFRFQMSFPDGVIDYPIEAVAVDGEQTRSIQMKFTRETPSRHTNTRENALEEWFV